MKRVSNGHGGKRRNAGRPTRVQQQLKEMLKKHLKPNIISVFENNR